MNVSGISSATTPTAPLKKVRSGPKPFRIVWSQHRMLYFMLVPSILLIILFNFVPLWGLSIGFVDFKPFKGVSGSPFVGLENFLRFFEMRNTYEIFRNTLVLAIGQILFGQFASVVFALLLNEIRAHTFKRFIQTATTLPYFMSWVILGGILVQFLSSTGVVNSLLASAGLAQVKFLGDPSIFQPTVIGTAVWKSFGFGAVIYLAALAAINPELYQAAAVDGADRWGMLWYVTLPGIFPTVVLMACLSLGGILNAGFDQLLVLQNPLVMSTGNVLDTWVYREGLLKSNYSLATAVGLFKSFVGFGLIILSYWMANKFANYRIF
jgi:putative aldouronate transport system permease protein